MRSEFSALRLLPNIVAPDALGTFEKLLKLLLKIPEINRVFNINDKPVIWRQKWQLWNYITVKNSLLFVLMVAQLQYCLKTLSYSYYNLLLATY